jgi:hypothetical protein
MSTAERTEAEAFGRSEELLERILTDFETCGLVGERHNKLLCYLAAVSRKMDEPLSVLVLSSSGAGKTALQDATLAFCPPEDVVKLTSLTGKALFYKERSYPALLERAAADGLDAAALRRFAAWLPGGRVAQKREDAEALLRHLAAGTLGTSPAAFRFERTLHWEQAVAGGAPR